jgi:hypothetical protein
MAKALFVSDTYVKKKSIISGSVDPDSMLQFIETAQDMHVQNYLGTELYKKLMLLVSNGTIIDVANSDYKGLLDDFIKPMLAWYTQAEYIPFASYTLSNKGLFKHSSDNASTLDREEIAGLANRANDKAVFYTNRLINYLCDNSILFPEYNDTTEDMSPDKDANTAGFYLG